MAGIRTPTTRQLYSPEYIERVLATDPIGYWVLDEKQGAIAWDQVTLRRLTARHGAHTGVTLYQPGIGDGRTSPFYDGATDFTDVYTASFRDAFALANNDDIPGSEVSEGAAAVWAKVDGAGVWTDGAQRYLLALYADANNLAAIRKEVANNRVTLIYVAGGIIEFQSIDGLTTTDWMHLGMTWSKSAGTGEVRYFLDGTQQGATDVSLGAWAEDLAVTTTVVGSFNTAALFPWHGQLAHAAVWDRPLMPAEMADLAVVG